MHKYIHRASIISLTEQLHAAEVRATAVNTAPVQSSPSSVSNSAVESEGLARRLRVELSRSQHLSDKVQALQLERANLVAGYKDLSGL